MYLFNNKSETMKKFYILGLLTLGLMISCQQDECSLEDSKSHQDFVVTASLSELPDTRTQLSPDANGYKVVWSENDAFSAFNAGCHYKYLLKSGVGQTTAEFQFMEGDTSGNIDDKIDSNVFIGVYPYSGDTEVSKSDDDDNYLINTVIPTTQNYVNGSFGQNTAPMIGLNLNNYPKFSFKNVASVLIMPLKGNCSITSATLKSNAHMIAGTAIVSFDGYTPIIKAERLDASKITLSCGNGVVLNDEAPTNFCFVLAPGTYEANDLVVTFHNSEGKYFETKITAENTFTRSKTRTFSARTFEVIGDTPLNVENTNNALASGNSNVNVEIEEGNNYPVFSLPENSESEGSPTTLNFENIPANIPVTIQAGTESSPEDVNINVPDNDQQDGYEFIINLPESSVNLNATGNGSTFEEVTATTAANTLIIGNKVTINKLNVKGGNVRVKNGATIGCR